jgi:hypothetical protein
MSAPRFIGQDTELLISVDGKPLSNITAIASHEFTVKINMIEKGYVGELSDRLDEVFKGISGAFEAHDSDGSVLELVSTIMARAQRRIPPIPKVTVKTVIVFPENGRRALITMPDAKFGDIPVGVSDRESHGSFRFTYGAEIAGLIFR